MFLWDVLVVLLVVVLELGGVEVVVGCECGFQLVVECECGIGSGVVVGDFGQFELYVLEIEVVWIEGDDFCVGVFGEQVGKFCCGVYVVEKCGECVLGVCVLVEEDADGVVVFENVEGFGEVFFL